MQKWTAVIAKIANAQSELLLEIRSSEEKRTAVDGSLKSLQEAIDAIDDERALQKEYVGYSLKVSRDFLARLSVLKQQCYDDLSVIEDDLTGLTVKLNNLMKEKKKYEKLVESIELSERAKLRRQEDAELDDRIIMARPLR